MRDVANISDEPISLREIGRRAPSDAGEVSSCWIICTFPEKDLLVARKNELPGRVHTEGGFIATKLVSSKDLIGRTVNKAYLDHNSALVEPNTDLIRVFPQRYTPRALHGIAESILETICAAIPHLDRSILASTNDDGEVGVEYSKGDVVGVAFHGLYTTFAEIVPDLDRLVVASGDEIRFVRARIKVDIVYTLIVGVHGEVGGGRTY